jgi:hypothetical protein
MFEYRAIEDEVVRMDRLSTACGDICWDKKRLRDDIMNAAETARLSFRKTLIADHVVY